MMKWQNHNNGDMAKFQHVRMQYEFLLTYFYKLPSLLRMDCLCQSKITLVNKLLLVSLILIVFCIILQLKVCPFHLYFTFLPLCIWCSLQFQLWHILHLRIPLCIPLHPHTFLIINIILPVHLNLYLHHIITRHNILPPLHIHLLTLHVPLSLSIGPHLPHFPYFSNVFLIADHIITTPKELYAFIFWIHWFPSLLCEVLNRNKNND